MTLHNVDALVVRGYLECMILLSEVAEKVHNEFSSWPSIKSQFLHFRCIPPLKDARVGDDRLLVEILIIAIGLTFAGDNVMEISISGTDDEVRIDFPSIGKESGRKVLDWTSLKARGAAWNPVINDNGSGISIVLSMAASEIDPPVDLNAMARETGLRIEEARLVLDGFLGNGRRHLEVLRGKPTGPDSEERFRAAHSLKGAGKNLRAPELAAAARVIERGIREEGKMEIDLKPLESAWNRIERWYKEVKP